MARASGIEADIDRVVTAAQGVAAGALDAGRPDEAKKALASAIRDLRDLKRELNDRERQARLDLQDARLKARQRGQVAGAFMSSKARGAMARGRAAEGRAISAKQQEVTRHYAQLKSKIDNAIATLDRDRARVADLRSDSTEIPMAAPAPAPLPPPQWAADPSGRHQHRWWDGAQWTDHVSDAGAPSVDPM